MIGLMIEAAAALGELEETRGRGHVYGTTVSRKITEIQTYGRLQIILALKFGGKALESCPELSTIFHNDASEKTQQVLAGSQQGVYAHFQFFQEDRYS